MKRNIIVITISMADFQTSYLQADSSMGRRRARPRPFKAWRLDMAGEGMAGMLEEGRRIKCKG
jgi:hypothetical protein